MKSALPLALLLVFVSLGRPAEACDCVGPRPLSSAVRTESPFIFEGKAVEIVERSLQTRRITGGGGSTESKPLSREVVFEVSRAWHGVTTKRIAVGSEESDCMFLFEMDRSYIVFAWKDAKGAPATHSCTRTVESSKASDVLKYLGPATVPK